MNSPVSELRIDPEFESKVPPLTDDEYRQLEENILSEEVVLTPLIVWKGTIVDGNISLGCGILRRFKRSC